MEAVNVKALQKRYAEIDSDGNREFLEKYGAGNIMAVTDALMIAVETQAAEITELRLKEHE